jgi:hypothetical protein
MVTQPWWFAAFDVAIRTPFPSSLHLSVLYLFLSTPLRWRSRRASHCTAWTLPFTPGPPILHQLLHNLPCLCLCRSITSAILDPSVVTSSTQFVSALRSLQFLPGTFDSTFHIMCWYSLSSTPRQPSNGRSPASLPSCAASRE